MRISELSEQSGVSVATLKFYLRRGLLQPGKAVSRTMAEYDDEHVARVRLVKALSEVGGLELNAVERVLEAINGHADDRLGILATAQCALSRERAEPDHTPDATRVLEWVGARGWAVDASSPPVLDLETAWSACDAAGIELSAEQLNSYADAVEQISRIDLGTVPSDPVAAVRQVVLGTVLVDPVLAALRRLAQQHISLTSDH